MVLCKGKDLDAWYTKDGAIRIAGQEWGGAAHNERAAKVRDSGILVHGVGESGAASGVWLASVDRGSSRAAPATS